MKHVAIYYEEGEYAYASTVKAIVSASDADPAVMEQIPTNRDAAAKLLQNLLYVSEKVVFLILRDTPSTTARAMATILFWGATEAYCPVVMQRGKRVKYTVFGLVTPATLRMYGAEFAADAQKRIGYTKLYVPQEG